MMNGRHLPAGQQNHIPQDMGRRQRQYNQNHQQQQYQQQGPVYNGYQPQYNANNNYYPPQYQQHQYQQQYAPQYHNAGSPYPQVPYGPPPHVRSPPPSMQHYGPPPIAQHPYPRPQPSPATSTQYQQPPPPPPPQTPPSTHSSHTVPGPMTPPTPQTNLSVAASPPRPAAFTRPPFKVPLPWLSRPDEPWPTKRPRRKKKPTPGPIESVELPYIQPVASPEPEALTQTEEPAPRPETPSTSHPASEQAESTVPTTPSSVQPPTSNQGETTPVAGKISRSTVPAIPIIPVLPKKLPKDTSRPASEKTSEESQLPAATPSEAGTNAIPAPEAATERQKEETEEAKPAPPAPKAWSTPKSWTGLFNAGSTTATAKAEDQTATVPSLGKPGAESLAEALRSFSATSNDAKVAFLEPRGLVNTGNMCYMNSVLQVLVFCTPFYNFLDQVGKRAVHSFNSDTPLIDAMIMFMKEYPIIDSATSVEKLRLRLKEGELEQYGEAFTPDFVYDVMKRLPRFVTMQRGHQQDAEEFLGFLLDGLHEECVHIMRTHSSNGTPEIATPINGPSSPTSEVASNAESVTAKENGWLEVGPKQKAAVTRSSGTITTGSPLTKIFGGNLRSEFRVPGLKDSVTLEPYQPLQLDIGASDVHNIVDALKHLTRAEPMQGDFNSPKGPNVTAMKQVFIETLPPVLILHLKRFQYDNAGAQKIWKKVGYPLELEMPKEVFSRQKRNVYAHGGLPKYRLIAVVYHHGKNASGGHYTVDVRRQDGSEWIRLDDTSIKRVRSEDVAEGGSEEDPKVLAAALDAHKKDSPSSGNSFSAIDGEEETTEENGWKQASGPGKKWSSIVNGTSTPKKSEKFSMKDNKVAYLLFYQRI